MVDSVADAQLFFDDLEWKVQILDVLGNGNEISDQHDFQALLVATARE